MNVFKTLVLAAASARAAPAGVRPGQAGGPPAGARGGLPRRCARRSSRGAGRSRLPRRGRVRRRRRARPPPAARRSPRSSPRAVVELALDQGQGGVGVRAVHVGLLDAAAALARGAAPVVVDAAAPSLGSWTRPCRASSRRRSARARPSSSSSRARPGADVKVVLEAVGGRVEAGRVADLAHGRFPQASPAARRRAAPRAAAPPRGRAGHAGRRPPGARRAVGLLVGIAYFADSQLGLTCIGAVQTPSRFATAHPPSTKEF